MKQIPTHAQIAALEAQVQADVAHWHDLKANGCSDPFWPDGVNMNLVRNHIIYALRQIAELRASDGQLSLFDIPGPEAGDVLIVKSIDRLGRNYAEILEQWRVITKGKRACIVVLDMPLLDTRRDTDLTGTLIADIVLQLLSYVAQVEREFIRQRQAEGIAAAKRSGVRFGREAKAKPEGYADCLRDWQAGRISARQAAAALGVCHKTFLRWALSD